MTSNEYEMIAVHEFQSNQGKLSKLSGGENSQERKFIDARSGAAGYQDSQAERIGYNDYKVPKIHLKQSEHVSGMGSIHNSLITSGSVGPKVT